jgi:hypothetical protein
MTLTIHNNKGEFTVSLEEFAEKFERYVKGADIAWIGAEMKDFPKDYKGV